MSVYLQKQQSLNIKYIVFALYSIEYRSKDLQIALHSVFMSVLHSVPIFLESGLPD